MQRIVYFEPLFREYGKALDDMLNWIIDSLENAPDEVREQILQKLKEKEVSIEIIYTIPVVFYPLYWQTRTKPKKVHILRLLIPITGRFSEPPTIFYGTQQDKLTDGNPLEYGAFNNLINNYAKEEIHYIKQMLKTNLNLNL